MNMNVCSTTPKSVFFSLTNKYRFYNNKILKNAFLFLQIFNMSKNLKNETEKALLGVLEYYFPLE